MPKGFAINNAPTDHGGVIQSTLLTMFQEDNAFVRAGDGHYCPQCKCWSTVVKSHDHMIMFGQSVAYVGDMLTCGARILEQQTHVVGKSHSSTQNSEHNYKAIQNNSQSQSLTNTTHSTTPHSSLKSENDELTEDDKLLTEEESNQIFQRCFKQTVDPMTIDHRKLATEMYFEAIGADSGVKPLKAIFKTVMTSWGAPKTVSTIFKKAISEEIKLQKYRLYNEKRRKYFKVGSFNNIDERFADTGQSVIAGVQLGYKTKFGLLNSGI